MDVNWSELFALSVAPIELIVRGSAMYWFLFLAFRFVLKRDVGAVGIADLLLLVIIADASQNAMAGEYRSTTDGFILVGTIIGRNDGLDYLAYQVPVVRRFVEPGKLCVVRGGRMLRRNMRRELITEQELAAKLREHGVSNIGEVSAAYMESDGEISVLKRSDGDDDTQKKRKAI